MPVIENKKIAFTQTDLDAVSLAPKVLEAMLAHNRSLIGPNRNTQAIFKDGRVCVDCARWKLWSGYYHDNARAGGSGRMGRCKECNRLDCARRYIDRM
ncbi:MAG: hypothetical protein JO223_09355 [Hyphomicrobiales bacterium]|nr:hypothetical protein [Hyphomicrobiales bacterium]MBV8443602.1 hypothetical protein [Hyphomicrobiales bacterium]